MKKGSQKSLQKELKKLLDEIRRQNRRALERRLYDLTAAYNIGKEASSFFDLRKCLRILTDRIADLMSVEIISLMLMDKDSGALVVKLAKGLDKQIIRETKVKVGESIAGWIAKTGEPLLIKDITKDKRFPYWGGKYYTNSLLSVPLKIRDKVIGVINVNNKVTREVFKEEDLAVLKTIAELAAVAVENARLHEDARSLIKSKSDFVSHVSHELRAPLAAIRESVILLLDGITGNINENQRTFLELAKNNIERVGRLIDKLLDLARVESGKVSMKRSFFDIALLLESAVAAFTPLVKKKGLALNAMFSKRKIFIWGDMDKLFEVVTNLLDNAIKYNKSNGTIEVWLNDFKHEVKFYVRDTGVGIAKQDLKKIFRQFFRVGKPQENQAKGSGLGLYIAREIVAMHGGRIRVKSRLGEGSTFEVSLPKNLRRKAQ
ncbi:MAG: GAF domain-containing sensor histidine kinase [Candidatus Omnitrophica bacterium]|nr:GAF domain-containing sensor histidine kinase [Candidatus Omnitrophota bacterium]